MRKNITLSVKTDDGSILTPVGKFAISGENYQGNLIFELDKPIEGAGTILIHKDATIYQVPASHDDTYTSFYIPILNSILTTSGIINVQLRITEQVEDEHTPIFKSEIATGVISSAISEGIDNLEEYDDYFIIVDTLRNEVESAEGDISTLQSDMETAKSDIDAAELRLDNVEGDVDSLETRMGTAEDDITTNAGNISNLQSSMTTAENNITSLTGRMSSVESRLSTLESKVATLEDKVQTLENKVSTIERYNYLVIEGV